MQKNLVLQSYNNAKANLTLLNNSLEKYQEYLGYLDKKEDLNNPAISEYFDALSFRYEKTIEMFISFFRTLELFLFGLNSKTIRELLLRMEKLEIVQSAEKWMDARILRNMITHTYKAEIMEDIYYKIFVFSEMVNSDYKKISSYLSTI